MELKFLGRGAAFYPEEGNNSAYFIENNELFLIDCGESTFSRLKTSGILNDINSIYFMCTHTHSDHIGSLGSLVLYSYYELKKPLMIILPSQAKYLTNLENILKGFGITQEMYHYFTEKEFDDKYKNFKNIRYIETSHCKELSSYGILFNTNQGIVYYSGDTNDIKLLNTLISLDSMLDKLYLDTTLSNYPGNVHLYIGDLNKIIPDTLKNKVYCMHVNSQECIEKVHEYGFHVVEIKDDIKILKK